MVQLKANFVHYQFIYVASFKIHKAVDMKSSRKTLSICTCGFEDICSSSFSPNRKTESKLGQPQPVVRTNGSLEMTYFLLDFDLLVV